MEKRMEKYPERTWIDGNYRGFEELYKIIREDRKEFLKSKEKD